jgi:hypothetical protein
MFWDRDEPFFDSSVDVPLPDLDIEFVEFLAKTFKKVTNRKVSPRSLWQQFKRLDRSGPVSLDSLSADLSVGTAEKRYPRIGESAL